jgi:hypothetical protein
MAKMRVGFTNIFSWRPHVEHNFYLAQLTQQAGHAVSFLTCDGDLSTCYNREFKSGTPDWLQCVACRAGGIRSYASDNVCSLGAATSLDKADMEACATWAQSSASTLGRFESNADFASPLFFQLAERLAPAVAHAYQGAKRWIERERLDAVCLFNGRMDVTRGILEAARDLGVPYISAERTWFGDGLQLLPNENCLGLRSVDRMAGEWRDVPLREHQALVAASYIGARFMRKNDKEWRAYNTSAEHKDWPVIAGKRRLLLIPSSRNEFWGHADWASSWSEPTAAYEAVIEQLGLKPADLVLRCHPNWAENIGSADGRLAETYFTDWARKHGVHVIPSADKTSTLGLIQQADAIVVGGGSAALEAGLLGKQVIGVSPSAYQNAGIQTPAYNLEQMSRLRLNVELNTAARAEEETRIARHTLRFCYTVAHRIAQYVPYVRAITTTEYEYVGGADPDRLSRLLASGNLEADDGEAAVSCTDEDSILQLIRAGDWEALLSARQSKVATPRGVAYPIRRLPVYRSLDKVRNMLPRGDL